PGAYDGLPTDNGLSDLDTTGRAGSIDAGDNKILVAPVDLGGHERGYLSAPLVAGTLTALALRTLEQGAVIFALYAIRERATRETEDRIKGDLLADLLADRFRDESEARERARHLGLDFSDAPLRVLILGHEPLDAYLERRELDTRSAGPLRARLLSLARSFATGATPPGIAGLDRDHPVVLLPLETGQDSRTSAERLLRLIRDDLPGLRARVAVSAPFTAPKDLAGIHKEAVSLLELADHLDAAEDVLCHDDWKIYGLLLRSSDREGLLETSHRVLDPLLSQDRSADLLATLETYLDNDLSPTRTAAALYVHTNTVKYRLGKLANIMDLDAQTLSGALTLKVALMVRHLDPEGFDAAVTPPD
ncbi:MAG TPA: helix-turn-helix domain-containing protein, partial [Rubrobacter sp.]|nr:helix-turn-helix domain-containing protein [Rubrobacter sp.]